MKFKISVRQNRTFLQRFNENALWWGIPMVCVELIGVPLWGWQTALVIAVPVTLATVLAKAAIEHFLVSALARRNDLKAPTSP
jgi:hypothetical protein